MQQQPRSLLESPEQAQRATPHQRHEPQPQRTPPAQRRQGHSPSQAVRGRKPQQQAVHRGYPQQQQQLVRGGKSLLGEPGYYEQAVDNSAEYEPYAEGQFMEQEYHQEAYVEEPYVEPQYAEPQYVEQNYGKEYVEQEVYPESQQFAVEPYFEEEQVDAGSLMEYAEQRHGMRQRNEFGRDQQGANAQKRQQTQQAGRDHGRQSSRNQAGQGRNQSGQGRNQAGQGRNQSGHGRNQAGGQERNKQKSPGRNQPNVGAGMARQSPNAQSRRSHSRPGGAGLLDHPDNRARMMREQASGGLLESPVQQQLQSEMLQRNAMQLAVERQANTQLDLLNKAELQMRLLEEEKMREMRELEQLNLLQQQQQAMLLQQQQQIQQQQMLQQHGMRGMGVEGRGNIPSIFDLPTGSAQRKQQLGKRPGGQMKPADNKRSRFGVSTSS